MVYVNMHAILFASVNSNRIPLKFIFYVHVSKVKQQKATPTPLATNSTHRGEMKMGITTITIATKTIC